MKFLAILITIGLFIFLFNTKMTDVIICDGKVSGIEVNNSEVIKK